MFLFGNIWSLDFGIHLRPRLDGTTSAGLDEFMKCERANFGNRSGLDVPGDAAPFGFDSAHGIDDERKRCSFRSGLVRKHGERDAALRGTAPEFFCFRAFENLLIPFRMK